MKVLPNRRSDDCKPVESFRRDFLALFVSVCPYKEGVHVIARLQYRRLVLGRLNLAIRATTRGSGLQPTG